MSTALKLIAAREELADALWMLDLAVCPDPNDTKTAATTKVANIRRKLSAAMAKLTSVESELALVEEAARK